MRGVAKAELVNRLWRDQSVWSQTADRMKTRIERARLAAMIVVVVVAAVATVAAQVADAAPVLAKVLAGVAAVGSGALPLLRPLWSGIALQNWTRARSVSEALKTAVYLWLTRAGHYCTDEDASTLRARTDRLLATVADLEDHCGGIEPKQRDLPAVIDPVSFFEVRVTGQIEKYYEPKARKLRSRLTQFAWIERGLGGAGLVLGAVAALTTASLAAWISVVATIGAALAVHVAATRYEFQRIEFRRTATRLRQLRDRAADASGNPNRLRELAVKAEDVISVENQGWMAQLAEDPPEQKTAIADGSPAK